MRGLCAALWDLSWASSTYPETQPWMQTTKPPKKQIVCGCYRYMERRGSVTEVLAGGKCYVRIDEKYLEAGKSVSHVQ